MFSGNSFGVTHIARDAFAGNLLAAVRIPAGATIDGPRDWVGIAGEGAFEGNLLESVVIPEGVTGIGGGAFARNQLASVVIPDRGRVKSSLKFSGWRAA